MKIVRIILVNTFIKIREFSVRRKLILCLALLLVFSRDTLSQNKRDFPIYDLWTGGVIPDSSNISILKNVKFRMVKKYEPDVDGFDWTHGAAIAYYRGQWFVSFGHNKGWENSGTEMAQYVRSSDGGRRWSVPAAIADPPGKSAVSHGVLFVHDDSLWSFNAAFEGHREQLHTNAYLWDAGSGKWKFRGKIAGDGFWPLQKPRQMENGEWIMAGASVEKETIPAVAICKNNDVLHWKVIKVPTGVKVWGECSVIVDGKNIVLISRSGTHTPKFKGLPHPLAWISFSHDYGHTWSELQPSNLPMVTSKPYTGILSNGQRYLIATTIMDFKNKRRPLTIAVSKPGKNTFCKVYCIRKAVYKKSDVESNPTSSLSYPYAIEHDNHLWVVYSDDGGRGGNRNSIELAIIPVKDLKTN